MYPWHQRLTTWANGTGLRIDALGLVTLLGAEEMDRMVGRLVASHYLDHLPLLGAFVVAANRFTSKQFGFTLYNISAGIVTTELAGWFSRWLRTQDLRQVRSVVTWEVVEQPAAAASASRWKTVLGGALPTLLALPVHGMLVALTVLTADWWGFANVVAMIVSVGVRCVLVTQNRAGIEANVRRAQQQARDYNYAQRRATYDETMRNPNRDQGRAIPEPKDPYATAKVIVVTDESKAVTIAAPAYLIQGLFTTTPRVPRPGFYQATRLLGWVAFGVHVVAIGMAALPTQICTVVVMVTATVLTAYKVGCDDSHVGRRIWKAVTGRKRDDTEKEAWSYTCWLSSRLKATVSSYPDSYSEWNEDEDQGEPEPKLPPVEVVEETDERRRARAVLDLETARPPPKKGKIVERRQDLYVWLRLTEEEESHMTAWGLMPRDREWMTVYLEKKMKHRRRFTEPRST